MRKEDVRGLLMLILVVVVWVLSGFFTQALFSDSGYNHPVAMTVFGVAACALLLLIPERKQEKAPLLFAARQNEIRTERTVLGVIWLAAQLLYNVSLQHMSVSANTLVSCASSLFTFGFSLWLLEGYSVTVPAMAALLCSTVGILLIQSLDDNGVTASTTGVCMAVGACACYGLFTTLIKRSAQRKERRGESESVVRLFGHLGLVSCFIGPFVVWFADISQIDPFALPGSMKPVVGMVINALLGSVLSDVLLAKAVLLLNPITVSLGLSLTMPFSLLLDCAVGKKPFHMAYLLSMALQFASVSFIAYDNVQQGRD